MTDKLRERAKVHAAAVAELAEKQKSNADLVAFIAAAVLREVLPAIADAIDYMSAADQHNKTVTTLQKIMARNQAIREATATGDWDALASIINAESARSPDGGAADQP